MKSIFGRKDAFGKRKDYSRRLEQYCRKAGGGKRLLHLASPLAGTGLEKTFQEEGLKWLGRREKLALAGGVNFFGLGKRRIGGDVDGRGERARFPGTEVSLVGGGFLGCGVGAPRVVL